MTASFSHCPACHRLNIHGATCTCGQRTDLPVTAHDDTEALAEAQYEVLQLLPRCTQCGSRFSDSHACGIAHAIIAADPLRHRMFEPLLAARDAAQRAEAWDEGYTSGHSNAMRHMSDEPDAPTTPNPYRANRGETETGS